MKDQKSLHTDVSAISFMNRHIPSYAEHVSTRPFGSMPTEANAEKDYNLVL